MSTLWISTRSISLEFEESKIVSTLTESQPISKLCLSPKVFYSFRNMTFPSKLQLISNSRARVRYGAPSLLCRGITTLHVPRSRRLRAASSFRLSKRSLHPSRTLFNLYVPLSVHLLLTLLLRASTGWRALQQQRCINTNTASLVF